MRVKKGKNLVKGRGTQAGRPCEQDAMERFGITPMGGGMPLVAIQQMHQPLHRQHEEGMMGDLRRGQLMGGIGRRTEEVVGGAIARVAACVGRMMVEGCLIPAVVMEIVLHADLSVGMMVMGKNRRRRHQQADDQHEQDGERAAQSHGAYVGRKVIYHAMVGM